MTNEELVQLYQQGNQQALEELMQQNKKFIYKVARKFFVGRDNALDTEDLIQEGHIGLMKAVERYDTSSDILFLTYAYYWIYQAMHRFMYPTRCMRENKGININSLNETVPGIDDNIEQMEALADEDVYPGITQNIANREDYLQIEQLITSNNETDERALQILKLRFGFEDGDCHTLEEIGNSIGITALEVRQISDKAFRYIRNSKWARLRRAEYEGYKKNSAYDTGRITEVFFESLDREIKGTAF